jgi:hypothetical protein
MVLPPTPVAERTAVIRLTWSGVSAMRSLHHVPGKLECLLANRRSTRVRTRRAECKRRLRQSIMLARYPIYFPLITAESGAGIPSARDILSVRRYVRKRGSDNSDRVDCRQSVRGGLRFGGRPLVIDAPAIRIGWSLLIIPRLVSSSEEHPR